MLASRLSGFLYTRLFCSVLTLTAVLPIMPAHAEGAYTAALQQALQRDPARFNDQMWALIRANPDQRDQIFHEAVRLSLQREIAADPARKEAILAKFKRLYPQMPDSLEAYAAGKTSLPPLPMVASVTPTQPKPIFANDPVSRGRGDWWGRNWPWVLVGGAVVGGATAGIIAATSKSSSGDAAPAANPASPAIPATPPTIGTEAEYNSQGGLGRINAAAANNAGFTGNGVKVAVVDSGVNLLHPDLSNNIATGGFDYIKATPNVTDSDDAIGGSFHGTHVAGIIAAGRNDFGIRGIAYDAKILPLAAIGNDAPLNAVRDAVIHASAEGAKVLNASYGPTGAVPFFVAARSQFFWNQALVEANTYLNAANSGMILVFAAGNSYSADSAAITSSPIGGAFLPFIRPSNANIAIGQPGAYRFSNDGETLTVLNADYSGLQGKLIAAVSVDANNVISSFSNRCGVAKDWCLAAPGENITSTSGGNSYDALSGTSFSAPHISGALAVLLQQHPELTPTQVVNLLLTTATDLGAPGVDDIYGHGLLNLGAASQSVGPFSVATGANLAGGTALLNNSSVTAGAAFGNQLTNALAATNIGVLDSYTRNYSVSLNQRVSTRTASMDSTTALQRFGQNEFRPNLALDTKNSLSFTLKAKSGLERAANDSPTSSLASYSFTHQVNDGAAVAVSHRAVRESALGFSEGDRTLLAAQMSGHGVGNPYLDFVADGYANNVTVDLPLSARFRATTAMGAPDNDSGQRNIMAMNEVAFGDEQTSLSLTAGVLVEQEQMLGLQGTGAFALGEGATTWFGGISGKWQIAPQTQLLASWYGGITDGSSAANSLVQGVDRIASTAWRVGVTHSGVMKDEDRLRFNITQPLRAESGALAVNLPQYRLRDGTIISQNINYGLAPTGRELDIETGYSFGISKASKMDVAAMYRHDAGHVAGKTEWLGLTRFSSPF